MKTLLSIVILLACAVPAYAAEESDSQLPGDSRIKLLMYDESDVYTITTRYGYQTNIVFAPQEEIETLSVGDRSLWQIIPAGNRIFIRPMEEDVVTNMTVLTNKHAYQFDLKSVPGDKTTGNIYVAKFVYPDTKKKAAAVAVAAPASPAPAPASAPASGITAMSSDVIVPSPFGYSPSVPTPAEEAATHATPAPNASTPAPGAAAASQSTPIPAAPAEKTAPPVVSSEPTPAAVQSAAPAPVAVAPSGTQAHPNYNYTFSGADDAAPLQVYDDGKSTFLKYRELKTPLPNVFVVGPTGKEMPATFSVKGDYMRVDAVAGELAVKNADGTVHVYNETLNPQ